MGSNERLVRNVSDTARWVAVYRAQESARDDALFRDPYAEKLAGDRGKAIASKMTQRASAGGGWWMVVRTRLIDDLIAASIREGCERVLNLAAGLDSRPYRMDLPESLEWIEADLAPMIEEKEKLLEGEKPRCRLRRDKVDLADAKARAAFLDRATAGEKKTLVLTEGLLIYLDPDDVDALGRDFASRASVKWWVLDVTGPGIADMMRRRMGAELESAPLKFAPYDGVAHFEYLGWRAKDVRSLFREAVRFRRVPWFMRMFSFLPDPDPRSPGRARWSAIVRLERA